MSRLVDWQIEALCINERMVEPFNSEMLNPASIDIRIGTTLQRETIFGGWKSVDLSKYSKARPYWLYPKQFVLVGSYEIFNLPSTVTAEFKLKSSRAREGYENSLAGFADPGWSNSCLTMEIENLRCFQRLPIYPGLRIGQFVFTPCEEPRAHYGITGRYCNDRTVMGSKG